MKLLRYMQGPLYDAVPDDGAGGGGGTPAAFDHVAFRAQILGDVTKLFTGFGATLKADLAKITTVTPVAAVEPVVPDAAGGGAKPPIDPALAAQIRALERTNKELADKFTLSQTQSAAKEAVANKKEQDAIVRTKLNKFKFADEAAAQDAFDIFGAKVKRTEDGAFVGGDGTPLDQFLEEGMRTKQYLLAPKDVSGGGARPGGAGGNGGSKAVDLNTIKPGMTPAELAAASARISEVVKQAMQGQ
jgi:hypothetical protein